MIVVKERLEELNNLMQDSVSEFYDAYTPHVYDREYRLYDVVQVRTDERKTDFKVVYMAEFLPPYDVAEEYIYDLIFLHGYHGGATSGKTKAGVEHPDGKTPYWKKPVPTFTEWGKKAKKTTSIKYIINKNERNWRNNELERYIDDAFTRVMSSYDAVKKLGYFVYL